MKTFTITDDLSEVSNLHHYFIVLDNGDWSEAYEFFDECLGDAESPSKIIGMSNAPRYTGRITDFELGGIYAYAMEDNTINLTDMVECDVSFSDLDELDDFVSDLVDQISCVAPSSYSVRSAYESVWCRYHFEPVCEIQVTQEYLDTRDDN